MLHIKCELVWKRYELHCHSLHKPEYKPEISNVIKMRSAASGIKHAVTPSPYYVLISTIITKMYYGDMCILNVTGGFKNVF